jgi:glycosidase
MSDQAVSALSDKPAWVSDAVFYQIFPDRFARSKRVSKPANLSDWHAPPSPHGYHGGDLFGICERLDHLVDLGINAIYLNPIFQSACNHRYHTHDYRRVDPLLGGDSALRELVDEAHSRNMHIILDGVFNHASRGFFQFNDILENGPHSPWLDWFKIQGWPLAPYDGRHAANYACWNGNRALPQFNTENPEVREFLMQVGEFWIREYDIDGWRLDVPQEITTSGFWEEFRARVRAIKSDAYVLGEIWRDTDEWLKGDRFDATMNYVFAAATIAFAAGDRVSGELVQDRSYDPYPGINAAQLGERLQCLLRQYDWATTQVQFNLLASHDTPRVLSVARGDKATLRLATLIQMTFPGTPSIYYGDEIGLRGTEQYDHPHQDHDSRWPFPWHDKTAWDHEMLQYFQQLIALRHTHSALRHGAFEQLYADQQQYAFLRYDSSHRLVVILNSADASAQTRVPVIPHLLEGQSLKPLFGTTTESVVQSGHVAVTIPPRVGVVLEQ